MIKLYEISDAYRNLPVLMETMPEDEFNELLNNLDKNFVAKVSGIASIISEMETTEDALKIHKQKIDQKLKTIKNKRMRLKQYISDCMVQAGKDRLDGNVITLSFRKSTSVEIIDEPRIPDKYFRIKREVDKKTIMSDYKKTGIEILGTKIVEKKNLQIK